MSILYEKNNTQLYELLIKGRIKEFFQLLIYYNYKVDLIILYYATLMPYYLIFIFCFFFGNFGFPEGIADDVLFFQILMLSVFMVSYRDKSLCFYIFPDSLFKRILIQSFGERIVLVALESS